MTDTDGQSQTEEMRLLIAQITETNRRLGALEQRMVVFEQRMVVFEQRMVAFEQRMGTFDQKLDLLIQVVNRLEVRVSVLENTTEAIKVHGATKADIHQALHSYTWKMIAFVSALVAAAYTAGAILGTP